MIDLVDVMPWVLGLEFVMLVWGYRRWWNRHMADRHGPFW